MVPLPDSASPPLVEVKFGPVTSKLPNTLTTNESTWMVPIPGALEVAGHERRC